MRAARAQRTFRIKGKPGNLDALRAIGYKRWRRLTSLCLSLFLCSFSFPLALSLTFPTSFFFEVPRLPRGAASFTNFRSALLSFSAPCTHERVFLLVLSIRRRETFVPVAGVRARVPIFFGMPFLPFSLSSSSSRTLSARFAWAEYFQGVAGGGGRLFRQHADVITMKTHASFFIRNALSSFLYGLRPAEREEKRETRGEEEEE